MFLEHPAIVWMVRPNLIANEGFELLFLHPLDFPVIGFLQFFKCERTARHYSTSSESVYVKVEG